MSSGNWGGARENTGPKKAGYVPPAGRAEFEIERAEHERVKREQREFKLAVEKGRYSPRDHVQQAASTALSVLTQSLRSLPDNLERTLSLQPHVVEAIALQIDAALTELAAAFKLMTEAPTQQKDHS